jgi:hypothetical protein
VGCINLIPGERQPGGCRSTVAARHRPGGNRNLVWSLQESGSSARFLIRDNDAKFGGAFDEVFRSEGIEVIRTPLEAPKANAIAERFVGTVRPECLDWLLIVNRPHLERVLQTFIEVKSQHVV